MGDAVCHNFRIAQNIFSFAIGERLRTGLVPTTLDNNNVIHWVLGAKITRKNLFKMIAWDMDPYPKAI